MPASILVVDDEPDIRDIVRDILDDEGYQAVTAPDAAAARQCLEKQEFDLALLDIWMPGTDGIALLQEWVDQRRAFPVIMISGHGNVETAVEAIRIGAYDFLEKPLSTAKLLVTVNRALESNRLQRENRALRERAALSSVLLGESQEMVRLRERLRRIGESDSWVLISGEPGTGKEVAARMLHESSHRRAKPFVHVNLAAIPAARVPAHLFGADSERESRRGSFEEAAGGTLLLDQVVDLDAATQASLLNALEQGSITRLGGGATADLDVRILSTTNRSIENAVSQGGFREDLYYRLNVVPVRMPPLREHVEDIPLLVRHFADIVAKNEGISPPSFAAEAVAVLRRHNWPGNVRELRNAVQRILIFATEAKISADDARDAIGSRRRADAGPLVAGIDFDAPLRDAREQFERAYLRHHLQCFNGNVSELAQAVGMERTNLYRKLRGLGIDPKSQRNS